MEFCQPNKVMPVFSAQTKHLLKSIYRILQRHIYVFTDKEKDVEQPHKPEEPPGRIELCCKSSKYTTQTAQCMDSRTRTSYNENKFLAIKPVTI